MAYGASPSTKSIHSPWKGNAAMATDHIHEGNGWTKVVGFIMCFEFISTRNSDTVLQSR